MLFIQCDGWLEDITFHNSSSLPWDYYNRHVVAFFEASALKEVRILWVIYTITVQQYDANTKVLK